MRDIESIPSRFKVRSGNSVARNIRKIRIITTKEVPTFTPRIEERFSFDFSGALVISRTIQTSSPRLEKQLAEIITVVRKENTPNIAGPNCLEITQESKKTNSAFEALPEKIKREFLITTGSVEGLKNNGIV